MIDPTQPLQESIVTPTIGGQPNNQNALKFDTEEKRKAFCAAYCSHRKEGYSKESFHHKGSGIKVFDDYKVKFPLEFPTDMIQEAEIENLRFWEEAGIQGMRGKIKGYNSDSWKFNMSNRFKWKMREDVTTDGKEVVGPIVYMPKEEA